LNKEQLRAVIDRLVEDSIRRILPGVMNEVLLRTIVDSGVLSESRSPVRPPPAKRPPPKRSRPNGSPDLSRFLDDSTGADAYQDWERRVGQPIQLHEQATRSIQDHEYDDSEDSEDDPLPIAQRLASLNPEIQQMAEGMVIHDHDAGEMWGDEHDATSVVPDLPPVRDIGVAARSVGIDFSRMASTIAATPSNKPTAEDVRAKAQFEERRLKMMRERLNGGKPLE